MKKFILLLASLAMATGAFAQEGPTFKYNVFAQASAYQTQTAAESIKKASHIRVRPKFTAAMGNVSVVTYLEVDGKFGSKGPDKDDAYFGKGADEKGIVEVKNVYINVKDAFVPGLALKAGVFGYKFPLALNDDFAGFEACYNAGMAKVAYDYIKFQENNEVDDNAGTEAKDDAQMHSLKAMIKTGNMTITPAYVFAVGEENVGDSQQHMLGVSFSMKEGPLGVFANGAYIMGKDKSSGTEVDIAAYAAELKVSYKVMPMLTAEVFGMYASGSDTEDKTEFSAVDGSGDIEGGQLFMINDKGYFTHVGAMFKEAEYDRAGLSDGIMIFGVAAKGAVDKMKYVAQVGYAQCTSDKGGVSDKGIGTEFDLRVGYSVAPKSELYVETAYLLAGKYVEATQSDKKDPMYLTVGLRTSI